MLRPIVQGPPASTSLSRRRHTSYKSVDVPAKSRCGESLPVKILRYFHRKFNEIKSYEEFPLRACTVPRNQHAPLNGPNIAQRRISAPVPWVNLCPQLRAQRSPDRRLCFDPVSVYATPSGLETIGALTLQTFSETVPGPHRAAHEPAALRSPASAFPSTSGYRRTPGRGSGPRPCISISPL